MSIYIKPRGQSLVEYSVVLVIIAAAVMSMQLYMKRGLQAAVKIQADRLGPQQKQINTSDRQQSSTNSFSSETRDGVNIRQVSAGGGQSITTTSIDTQSGTINSISTLNWSTP